MATKWGTSLPVVAVLDAEVALMLAHLRDQDLRGELEVRRVEAPEDGHRPLHQIGHLVEEGRVGAQPPVGALGADGLLGQGVDPVAPRLDVGEDVGRFQGLEVAGGALQGDGPRVHEPVAPGLPAAVHGAEAHREHLPAEERHDPVDRPGEGGVAVAPAHGLLEGERAHQLLEELGEDVLGGAPGLVDLGGDVGALPGLHHLRASTGTPCPRAKPSAARVGLPSASKAALAGGPVTTLDTSGCLGGTSWAMTASRLGVP